MFKITVESDSKGREYSCEYFGHDVMTEEFVLKPKGAGVKRIDFKNIKKITIEKES